MVGELIFPAFLLRVSMTELEQVIIEMTKPVGGQFPRPWMTDMIAPHEANIFIVGANQAKGYDVSMLTHERHINALFNRAGESCRGLYDELTGFTPSRTRLNIDKFRALLDLVGVCKAIETNVVCYSTPMSKDLHLSQNIAGAKKGRELFTALLRIIKPKVLIAHGSGASKELSRVLDFQLPPVPKNPATLAAAKNGTQTVFVIPSLAPPAFNKWSSWSDVYLEAVARAVAKVL
ncbi:hypothetical protein D9M68_648310 [compost metagenome]